MMGCETATEKANAADENVEEARQKLKEAQQTAEATAKKAATVEEWNAFKIETETKITKNEKRISELRIKINKSGTAFDKSNANRIDVLEQTNKDLRIRMETYDKSQNDWDSFKRELNHDMDELGKALVDFTENNKN